MSEAREHDFTSMGWGWTFFLWDGERRGQDDPAKGMKFTGHGHGLREGDAVLLQMESGRVGRWRLSKVEYMRDPTDMFFATAALEGYV